ncbi:MAG TPA: glycosyltransferase family 2 protein [Solirubrobacteraceae bacterium]
MSAPDAIAVVIVVHHSAPELRRTLPALASQLQPDDEVIVVDNAGDPQDVALVHETIPQAIVVHAPRNLGFAGGANLGAEHAQAPLLLLLNPDATPAPDCLTQLRQAATNHPDWGAFQALVTLDGGTTVNTAGNRLHWLGFGWAGDLGTPTSQTPRHDREVGFASGAALLVRTQAWTQAQGFDPDYFLYCEDVDLTLRLRLRGWRVGIAPTATVDHAYEFDKGDYKWFYLERNRWWTILADYPPTLLAVALPALLAAELALLAVAARGGWLPAKLRANAAVLRSLPAVRARRRTVQRTRTTSAKQFAEHLTDALDSPNLSLPEPINRAQRAYWRAAQRLL